MDEHKSTYYKADGFVEYEVEIDQAVIIRAIEEYLWANADFDFDECDIHNDRPFGLSLTAKCRRYVNTDPDDPDCDRDEDIEADVETDEPYEERVDF